MARTRSITDTQILEAARELFLERGMTATTAEIARYAGVSEGTIFRRFPTKDELFRRALGIPEKPEWFSTLEQTPDSDMHSHLVMLGNQMLAFFQENVPRMMAFRSCGEEIFASMDEPPPVTALKGLSALFQRAMERGLIGPCAPEMVARVYMGSIVHYAVMDYTGINTRLSAEPEIYVRGVVETLWSGLAPKEEDHDH